MLEMRAPEGWRLRNVHHRPVAADSSDAIHGVLPKIDPDHRTGQPTPSARYSVALSRSHFAMSPGMK